MTPTTYKNCSEIPIYNFMMHVHNVDFSFLISNKKNVTDDQITQFLKDNEKDLIRHSKAMQNEYQSLTFNKKELNRQKEFANMRFLEIRHNTIIKIISVFLETKEITVLNILNSLNVKFDPKKPIQPQLEKAKNISIGLKNKLNIATANFKIKYKITDEQLEEDKKPNTEGIEKNLDSQALTLEANLETGYRINTRKTSVLRWVNLMEANEKRLEQFNK